MQKPKQLPPLAGLGAHVVSIITSEGALLSASPRKSRARTATGGLLRQIGDHGILVIKDFTSIISANREIRTQVLAVLREIYDGYWIRNVGTDGDIIDAHAPEMPTRFAKQLTQIMRGALAIGMTRLRALALAIHCARNSMPPLRLAILEDIAANPGSRIIDVRRRLQRPRATADRALQALHVLGLLVCEEEEEQREDGPRYIRHYRLAQPISLDALSVPDLSVDLLF